MNIGHISTLVSLVLVLWSGSSFVLADHTTLRTQMPSLGSTDGQPVSSLGANLSHISEFKAYNVNELNPFVPYHKRVSERREWKRRRNKPNTKKPPKETPVVIAPPPKPLKLPTLELPKFKAKDVVVPSVLGVVEMGDRYMALVHIAGDEQQMTKDGDPFKGWVLKGIANQLATFVDPDGEELKVPIGMAGNEANVVSASATEAAQQGAAGQVNKLPGGIQLPEGLDVQKIMKMMSDPKQAGNMRQMMKDPRYRELLKDPAIRAYVQRAMAGNR